MPSNHPCVFVTGDLNMLRCFPPSRVRTVTLLDGSNEEVRWSRYCRDQARVPDAATDPDGYVDALIALAGTHHGGDADGRPILCYGVDHVMLAVSRHRQRLSRHFRFRMPPGEIMEACTDKTQFTALAKKHGLPVPRDLVIRNLHDPDALRAQAFYPCIVKSDFHVAAGGSHPYKVLPARNWEELKAALASYAGKTESVILQTLIEGGEEQIHSYHAYLDAQGSPLTEYLGRKIRTWPAFAGHSTYLELIRNDALLALGRDVVQRLGLVGPVKIDFKQDASSGRFYLLEFNLRFNLWNYLAMRAGNNLPMVAYRDLQGFLPQPPGSYRTHLAWLSFGDDLRSFLRCYRPQGLLSTTQWLRSFLRPKVYTMFAWTDPLPALCYGFQYVARWFRQHLGLAPEPRPVPAIPDNNPRHRR